MSLPIPILAEAGGLERGEPSPQAPAPAAGSLVHQLMQRLSGASLLSTEGDRPSPASLPPHPWPALRLSSVSTRRVATAEQEGSTPKVRRRGGEAACL